VTIQEATRVAPEELLGGGIPPAVASDSRRIAGAALLLLPAGLVAFFALNSGGFYPGPPAYVAVTLCIVLTHQWPATPESPLSFRMTYTNALGVLGAFGSVPCLHFSSDHRESLATRVIAAAALPVVATTVYFTFSQGAAVGPEIRCWTT
jgi:hypothetical protein